MGRQWRAVRPLLAVDEKESESTVPSWAERARSRWNRLEIVLRERARVKRRGSTSQMGLHAGSKYERELIDLIRISESHTVTS